MNKLRKNDPIPVGLIGEGALRILSGTNQGKVLACVSGAIYLADQQDEVFWLIPPGGMMHRRAIQSAGLSNRLKPGMLFTSRDRILMVESGDRLDLSHSITWKSPSLPAAQSTLEKVHTSLTAVLGRLLDMKAPTGFGLLIHPILQIALGNKGSVEANRIGGIVGQAWPSIQGIMRASTEGDILLWEKCAQSLVGLGEGLTPSGDDFLGGFFFASCLLHRAYPAENKIPDRTYSVFIDQAKSLTNLISYTMLKEHATGHSLATLEHLADGLLQGEPGSQLEDAEQLISVGHSTGWDILAGFTAEMIAAQQLHPALMQ